MPVWLSLDLFPVGFPTLPVIGSGESPAFIFFSSSFPFPFLFLLSLPDPGPISFPVPFFPTLCRKRDDADNDRKIPGRQRKRAKTLSKLFFLYIFISFFSLRYPDTSERHRSDLRVSSTCGGHHSSLIAQGRHSARKKNTPTLIFKTNPDRLDHNLEI